MKIADNLRQLYPSLVTAAEVSAALPFVIPSEAEGSAVQRASRGSVFRLGGVTGRRPARGMKIADNLRQLYPSLVTAAEVSAALPFVIPSEAEGSAVQQASRGNVFRLGGVTGRSPTRGMKIADNLRQLCPSLVTAAEVSAALPFVIPSEAEGSAVQQASRGNVFRLGGVTGRSPTRGMKIADNLRQLCPSLVTAAEVSAPSPLSSRA